MKIVVVKKTSTTVKKSVIKNETTSHNTMKKLLLLAVCSSYLIPSHVMSSKVDSVKNELNCLKANIFFEARGESLKGMEAVAQVTLNRVSVKRYPNNFCKVVFQPWQFSWTKELPWSRIQQIMNGNVKNLKKKDAEAYRRAKMLAEKTLRNNVKILPADVLHYHAVSVNPKWADKSKKYARIGNHVFYRGVK